MIDHEQTIPLMNATEELVQGIVRFLLYGPEYPTYCHCESCEAKVCAIALNHLQSHYVTTVEGREKAYMHLKQPAQMNEINKQVIHAIHIIGQNEHKKL